MYQTMPASPAPLIKLLQSDKVKERSAGRKGLEKLLQLDKKKEKFSTKEYSDMLRACITFECNEIHAVARSSRATYDTNNALFFKSVCKAHRSYGENCVFCSRSLIYSFFSICAESCPFLSLLFSHVISNQRGGFFHKGYRGSETSNNRDTRPKNTFELP